MNKVWMHIAVAAPHSVPCRTQEKKVSRASGALLFTIGRRCAIIQGDFPLWKIFCVHFPQRDETAVRESVRKICGKDIVDIKNERKQKSASRTGRRSGTS